MMMRVCDFFIIIIYFFTFHSAYISLLSSRFTNSLTITSYVPAPAPIATVSQRTSQAGSQAVSQLAHSLVVHVLFEHHRNNNITSSKANIITSEISHQMRLI